MRAVWFHLHEALEKINSIIYIDRKQSNVSGAETGLIVTGEEH